MKIFIIGVLVLFLLASLSACVTSAKYNSDMQKSHPAIGQKVPVNGYDVHVITAGEVSAPPVLMIHGASANAREYTYTLAPRLESDHFVMMADRPGHGYSARPNNGAELGVQAAQMAGVLEQLAGGVPAIVVGHSFGGAVALRLALDRPDLVKGLVLSAPVSHDWGGGGEAWYNSYASTPVIGPIFSQLTPLVGPGQAKRGVLSVFDPVSAPEGYYEKSAIGLLFRPSNFRANAKDVSALQDELAAQEDRYGELDLPVIVFSGAEDTVIKPQLHVGKLKRQTDVELVALAHEGHMPHHGEGAAMADAIRRVASSE